MESSWRSSSRSLKLITIIIIFLSFSDIYCAVAAASARPLLSSCSETADSQCSPTENSHSDLVEASSSSLINIDNMRRISRNLRGPGSSPPRCYGKCGNCTPCRPVHVSVPPRTPVTSEYYPEAWRCKCRNKLYMP